MVNPLLSCFFNGHNMEGLSSINLYVQLMTLRVLSKFMQFFSCFSIMAIYQTHVWRYGIQSFNGTHLFSLQHFMKVMFSLNFTSYLMACKVFISELYYFPIYGFSGIGLPTTKNQEVKTKWPMVIYRCMNVIYCLSVQENGIHEYHKLTVIWRKIWFASF